MDINFLRTLMTVLAFTTFLGIVWWAFGPSRRERFEQDAKLVFDEDEGGAR